MNNPTESVENLMSRLPYLDSQPFFSGLRPEYTSRDIAMSITPANLLMALHRAREARELAISYRNFKVGAALLALRNSPASMQFLTGVNIKPEKNSAINVHAEQSAMKKARHAGFTAISIIAVVGETQNDQQSGHEMCTLHPCGLCRESLDISPLVNNDLTLIATALPDLRTIELSSVTRLGHYHDEQRFDAIAQLDVPDLNLLRPLGKDFSPQLTDNDETLAEDHTWHALVDEHLLPLRLG